MDRIVGCHDRPGPDRLVMRAVTAEDAVQMAALTRDFHPWKVLPRSAEQAGKQALVLHTAWISGLVGSVLWQIAANGRVVRWSINYHESAFLGERLSLEVSPPPEAANQSTVEVFFRVLGAARKLVADGEALIDLVVDRECRE